MDWESVWNVLDYYALERPRNRVRRWWGRHGTPLVRQWQRWRDTRRQARAVRQERSHMPLTIDQEALFKATAAQISQEFLAWLRQQHFAEFREDDAEQAAAVERAKAALAAEHDQRMEALADAGAAYKQQVQADADAELATALARERAKLARESEGELTSAQEERAEAQRRAAQAESALVALWQQLLPEDRQTYLHDAGITSLDLTVVNPILQRHRLTIAFQPAEASPRLVKVRVGEASWLAATRFWLAATESPVVPSPHGLVDPATYR
jgi:hypothetical protein